MDPWCMFHMQRWGVQAVSYGECRYTGPMTLQAIQDWAASRLLGLPAVPPVDLASLVGCIASRV